MDASVSYHLLPLSFRQQTGGPGHAHTTPRNTPPHLFILDLLTRWRSRTGDFKLSAVCDGEGVAICVCREGGVQLCVCMYEKERG